MNRPRFGTLAGMVGFMGMSMFTCEGVWTVETVGGSKLRTTFDGIPDGDF